MQIDAPLGSVTEWIRQLAVDHPQPAAVLWRRFEPQLMAYIIRRVRRGSRLQESEDALANAVFQSLITLARRGKLAQTNRHGFWKLMKTIAARRVSDQRRREESQKRGGGTVVTESVIRPHQASAHVILDQFSTKEPSPEILAMTAEFLRNVTELFDAENRVILNLRLDGHTVEEIAQKIGKSKPTVERKLRLIRETLQASLEDGDGNEPSE